MMDLRSKICEIKDFTEVLTCLPETPMGIVTQLMKDSRMGSIVICEKLKVIGIFTERDYLMKAAGGDEKFENTPVSEFMTKEPRTVTMADPVTKVLGLMNEGGFRHIIVVSETDELEGMVSVKDLLEFFIITIEEIENNLEELVACIA